MKIYAKTDSDDTLFTTTMLDYKTNYCISREYRYPKLEELKETSDDEVIVIIGYSFQHHEELIHYLSTSGKPYIWIACDPYIRELQLRFPWLKTGVCGYISSKKHMKLTGMTYRWFFNRRKWLGEFRSNNSIIEELIENSERKRFIDDYLAEMIKNKVYIPSELIGEE